MNVYEEDKNRFENISQSATCLFYSIHKLQSYQHLTSTVIETPDYSENSDTIFKWLIEWGKIDYKKN